ncbi:MarR family winged helix-turn-helix transcriptional regulator [Nocardia sp. NBC_01327]|uniref:MarR family winged helix-turn-helix transcriptional regulator n=1 Tax=Nocardia sp. NBC_01327 TaxID=2903593 RepID=UPI002E11A305|nr:MarR family transcriptional regulator [Nocardia sp. NBC_01327]
MAPLSDDELAAWHACKALGDQVTRRVGADIAAETGYSGTDYGVLSRVAELGGGSLRQQTLADSIGLHKGALSHQLTRMESRDLIRRERARGGVEVVLTAQGEQALRRVRPVHAAAVRKYLLDRLTDQDRAALLRIAAALG